MRRECRLAHAKRPGLARIAPRERRLQPPDAVPRAGRRLRDLRARAARRVRGRQRARRGDRAGQPARDGAPTRTSSAARWRCTTCARTGRATAPPRARSPWRRARLRRGARGARRPGRARPPALPGDGADPATSAAARGDPLRRPAPRPAGPVLPRRARLPALGLRPTPRATPTSWSRRASSRGRLVELLGIEPERVEVVHIGIDHERFTPEPGEDDERLLASSACPSASSSIPRTSGRTRTTSGCSRRSRAPATASSSWCSRARTTAASRG